MELELLPDHVLIEIFRSLSTHDLVNYRRVSKRWFRLIRTPKYFERAHRLRFAGCLLLATFPPLSVFKNSSQPFFRFLTIGKVEYNRKKAQKDWKNAWSVLGDCITHLKFNDSSFRTIYRILGAGKTWSQLIELEVHKVSFDLNEVDRTTIFPQKLKISSLKTLKLMCGDKSKDLEINFPNLQNLHLREMDGRPFSDWELQRLREVKCHPLQLRALNTNTIQTLSLYRHDGINLNDKRFIESFVSKQENLLELKIEISGIPALEYWCNWTQLTDLEIKLSRIAGPPLGNYFTQLKNLKSIEVDLNEFNSSCFFGHEVVDLPRLDKYSISTLNQCKECWRSCLESFTNAKDGAIYKCKEIKKYLYLLQNLESFTSDRVDCCLKVRDKEDRNLVIKPLPNVLKLISHYYYETIDELACRAITECFPNLRFLEIHFFNPMILKLLPGLQELFLNDPDACSRSMIEDIVQYGKNLRIIKFNGCREEHAKYLFDNLELLVQVSASDGDVVYTRSTMYYFCLCSQ